MKEWGKVIAFIASLIAIFAYFNNTLNDKIDQKINSPEFIKKISDEVRLPFFIFNDNESVIADTGALKYIKNFEIKRKEGKHITEIVITPNSYMAIPPILESIDDKDIGFEAAQKGKKLELTYKTIDLSSQWATMRNPNSKYQRRFRLQLVVLPEN